MGARWYDAALGRWTSADTIVPNPASPQSLNRYSWVRGNPLKYTDPTGHKEDGECGLNGQDCSEVALVYEGDAFRIPVEVALANFLLTGDPAYLDAIPDNVLPIALSCATDNVLTELGFQEPRSEPNLAVVFAAGHVGMGLVTGTGTRKTWTPSGARSFIKRLEQNVERAHAWSKHGPTAEADVKLQTTAARSSSPQTRFLTAEEMASSVELTLTTNMADIQARASGGYKHTWAHDGPEVSYVGYVQQGGRVVPITGHGSIKAVFLFDGAGGWGLLTAFSVHR